MAGRADPEPGPKIKVGLGGQPGSALSPPSMSFSHHPPGGTASPGLPPPSPGGPVPWYNPQAAVCLQWLSQGKDSDGRWPQARSHGTKSEADAN